VWRYIFNHKRFFFDINEMASSMTDITKSQKYDYFLVLDFEATCDEQRKIHPIEIIEFPVLKINARTFECESTFHSCKTYLFLKCKKTKFLSI
jgi:hypothetical protein